MNTRTVQERKHSTKNAKGRGGGGGGGGGVKLAHCHMLYSRRVSTTKKEDLANVVEQTL